MASRFDWIASAQTIEILFREKYYDLKILGLVNKKNLV